VAVELAPLFGTQIAAHSDPIGSTDGDLARREPPPGTAVALYSLMEQAAERTANILKRRHPGIEVVVLADHVASDRLRHAARTADLVVIMDRAAKHAATEAIREARGTKLLRFAVGKGSTSLLEAAESGLVDLMSLVQA
jgi:DNA-binding NarL/FixJ family response regulator